MKLNVIHPRANNTVNSAIDVMMSSDDMQDDACVGSFWYDPKSQELFGVSSEIASRIPFIKSEQFGRNVRTGGKLHKAIWKKEFHRGKDPRFKGNYTMTPRGRVFEIENEGFKVLVGEWIDDCPEAKQMVISEFELPPDTEFIKDTHWDIGHGWSEEYL